MKHCLVVGESRVIRKVACQILGEMKISTDEAEALNAGADAYFFKPFDREAMRSQFAPLSLDA